MPYIGKSPLHGNYSKLDSISGSFNGSTTQFALATNGIAVTPVTEAALLISINGVIQEPTTAYTVSGTNITFTSAPASGYTFYGVALGEQLAIGTPSDATVTAAKLASTFFTGATDIGAAIVDADLFLMDDGAGGTLRKTTASRLKTYIGGSDPSSADGDSLGTASAEWSDLYLADGGIIYFGNDQEITLTHSADSGLILKHTATADDKPINLVLQTGETDMAADDVIGKISFQAPDEGTGTDAILVSAAIQAVAEGDHSSSSNATKLSFMTGASEAATEKLALSSGGNLSLPTDSAVLSFGADSDVTVTHDPDDGLFLKSKATGTANPFVLTLQTGETDITTNDVLGTINFQAPDEHNGSDAILVGASIRAIAEENFSATNNATAIQFLTGRSETAATIARVGSRGTFEAQSGSTSYCSFTDIDDGHTGMYFPSGDVLGFVTGGNEAVRIDGYKMHIGDDAHSLLTQGLNINQGASDNECIALKSSDVAHGMTSQLETDTYSIMSKWSAANGGLSLVGASEGNQALVLRPFVTTEDTTKSHTGQSACEIYGVVKSGTSLDTLSGNVNALGVLGTSGHTQFIVDADGDVHYDGTTNAGAWDDYDDVELLDTFRSLTINDKDAAKNIFGDFLDAHAKVLNDTGVITLNEDGHHFVSTKGLNGLLIDSIRQTNARMKTIVNAVEEMVPGFSKTLNQKLEAQELPALPV